ncbi:secreted nuclease [Histomonas meleagridis]|uniref:secreted nuclease n=1 Tax=Histomonas meleagridis TaxID=135588 RepID=UPI0035597FDF|nr:secreted nuclease [Histomonas meleagridis]KAH0797934.1 secreted nuclease [Histomonas meleagridis]
MMFAFFLCIINKHIPTNGLKGESLRQKLKREYSAHTAFSYKTARVYMYNDIDCTDGQMFLMYSGTTYPWKCGRTTLPSGSVNCEHSVPQSFFNKEKPMVSDIHHLYPSASKINNARSNYPFVEVDYSECKKFCRDMDCTTSMPSNPDEYSCLVNGNKFMPRLEDRGELARGILYFYTMYDSYDMSRVGDLQTFLKWNREHPPTQREITRNDRINQTQGNRNPYVDDYTLADQAWA